MPIVEAFRSNFSSSSNPEIVMGVVSVGVLATTYLHSLVLLHCLNAEKVLMNILWEFRKPIKHYRPNGDFDTYANHNKQKKTFITKSFNAALLIKCTYLLTYVSTKVCPYIWHVKKCHLWRKTNVNCQNWYLSSAIKIYVSISRYSRIM